MNGKIEKKILKRPKKGELTFQFTYVEISPVTDSAYIRIVKRGLTNRFAPASRGFKQTYNIILYKTDKKPRIIRLNP